MAATGASSDITIGNDLTGKTTYVFETPEFHVVPGSGFPTDNLRIGACDDFQIRFSNRYDLDPNNLKKLELWQVTRKDSGTDDNGDSCDVSNRPECWDQDFRVAGGQSDDELLRFMVSQDCSSRA